MFSKAPIPFSKTGDKDIKNLIIYVLKEKRPLNISDIHHNIIDNFEPTITYQGIRKALMSLVREGIVCEPTHNGMFDFSKEWINQMQTFSRELVDFDPIRPPHLREMKDGEIKIIKFNTTMIEPYFWFLDECFNFVKTQKKKSKFVAYFVGIWPITMMGQEEFKKAKYVFSKNEPFVIDKFNVNTTKQTAAFWKENFGGMYRYGINLGKDEILIFSDFYIRKIEPESSVKLFDKFYWSGTLAVMGRLYKTLFSRKAPLTFIVTRDRKLAKQIRDEYMKMYFK